MVFALPFKPAVGRMSDAVLIDNIGSGDYGFNIIADGQEQFNLNPSLIMIKDISDVTVIYLFFDQYCN